MTVELAHPSTEPLASRSPTTPAHPRWWFLWTTPGRILTIGFVLSALVIASAFATSTTINDRQQALTTVLNHTEPLSFAAGQLYTTLSVADAAAATAFIAGAEPRDVRQRYEQAITDAAVAVTRASSGLTDEPMVQLLGRINAQLAVYTGLVETARTNNRAGNPVGSSYLSEASSLMQQTDPARRAAALRGDLGAGGRRDHRVDPDSRPGDPGGAGDAAVRRVRQPLAGPPHPAPREHRLRRGRDGGADHVDLGGHRAGDLDRRQPQRERTPRPSP